jgi:hypothetical protein
MGPNHYSCVFICEKGKITREMLHAEFEAILDSFVPLQEYAGQEMKAIYVQISPQLKVVAAVYFLIGFDGAGNADRRWNIPLEQLAEQAEAGPNLGAGPIRLACRSQCPVSWHTQSLWDPNMASDPNDFVLLRDVVKRNKLGFKKIEPEVDDTPAPAPEPVKKLSVNPDISDADKSLSADLVQFLRKKLDEEHVAEREDMAKKQRLLLAAQKTQFEDEINKLEEAHSEELRTMQQKFQDYHKVLEDQKKQNEKLRQQLLAQEEVVAETKALFEQKLAKDKEVGSGQLAAIKKDFANELQRKMDAAAREFKEVIAAKDMELMYRDDDKAALVAEVAKLNAEKARLISQGGEQFLHRLAENKVSFVAYHQGVGNINIDIESIGEYLSNPIAYVARSCKVTEQAYLQWLKHYDNPVCQSFSELKGELCGKPLKAVINPSQFVIGRSDRCPLHWSFGDMDTGSTYKGKS